MINEYYTWLIYGYHSDELSYGSDKPVVGVCDECGQYRSSKMSQYRDICFICARKHGHNTQKEPMHDGWKSKLCGLPINKQCPTYLGSIAEVILSNIYNDVQVMPNCNPGYDFICSKLFKIDVKSSALGDKYGYWLFTIDKNQIADYFLCIAFNSREDLYNPAHLWMIPGHIINHLSSASISKSTVGKWKQYELSLNKLIACCDNLNNDKED